MNDITRENEQLRRILSHFDLRNQVMTVNQLLNNLQLSINSQISRNPGNGANLPRVDDRIPEQNIMSDLFNYSELDSKVYEEANSIEDTKSCDNTPNFLKEKMHFIDNSGEFLFGDYCVDEQTVLVLVNDFLVFSESLKENIESDQLFTRFKAFFLRIEAENLKKMSEFKVCQICTFFGLIYGEKMKCINRDCGHFMHEACNVVLCKKIKMSSSDFKEVCPMCAMGIQENQSDTINVILDELA